MEPCPIEKVNLVCNITAEIRKYSKKKSENERNENRQTSVLAAPHHNTFGLIEVKDETLTKIMTSVRHEKKKIFAKEMFL